MGAFVAPRSEGIAELTVSYKCKSGLSRTVPVAVGAAAVYKPFAATPKEAAYYPARLELTVPGSAPVSEGRLFIKNGDKDQFIGSAFNRNGERITPNEFPIKWSVSDESVLRVAEERDNTAFIEAVGAGTATVTLTVEGLSKSFDVTVGADKPQSSDAPTTLVTRSATIQAVRPVTVATQTTMVVSPVTVNTSKTAPATAGDVESQRPQNASSNATSQSSARIGSTNKPVGAKESTASLPEVVPAKGLRIYAGYSNNSLSWHPAPGAAGYRIARLSAADNHMVTLTGDVVSEDGHGLVTDTTFVDTDVIPNHQYVYYLATYYKNRDGTYSFPPASTEQHMAATVRDASGKPWLPADWQDAPVFTTAEILPGKLIHLAWKPKFALGYVIFTSYQDEVMPGYPPDRPVRCTDTFAIPYEPSLPGHWVFTGTEITKAIVESYKDFSSETMHSVYCVSVWAVYPDEIVNGTPSLNGREFTGAGTDNGVTILANHPAAAGAVSRPAYIAVARTGEWNTPHTWEIVPKSDIHVSWCTVDSRSC